MVNLTIVKNVIIHIKTKWRTVPKAESNILWKMQLRFWYNQECLENNSKVWEKFTCLDCNKILKTGDKKVDESK